MRARVMLFILLLPAAVRAAGNTGRWDHLIAPSHTQLRAIVNGFPKTQPAEEVVLRVVRGADSSFTLDELATMVRMSSLCCRDSSPVALELTQMLRENHRIYSGRLPTDASQFRGFLLASLAAFPPSDALYGHVRNELVFGGHAYAIAAAAVAARSFPEKAEHLLPAMERYLAPGYDDEWVDLTTPHLNDVPLNRTRARHEIIRTLVAFGPRAWRSVAVLDQIAACRNCGTYATDAALPREAANAAEQLRKLTPACCRTHAPAAPEAQGLTVIARRERKPFASQSMKLIDQDGRSLDFAALRGRPFVLTFFYSRCTNVSKCVMTVRRLAALAADCAENDLADRVGVYGMTYDPQFDGPALLRKFGSMNGMKFSRNVRLLKTQAELASAFRDRLALRVNYGGGSVNQHGVQLFVFDKSGRLAATHDEDWSPADVRTLLSRLAAE